MVLRVVQSANISLELGIVRGEFPAGKLFGRCRLGNMIFQGGFCSQVGLHSVSVYIYMGGRGAGVCVCVWGGGGGGGVLIRSMG